MTDAELNKMFADKKQEIIDQLIGKDVSCPVSDEIETRVVDANWNKHKPFYDNPRVLKNMNNRNTVDQAIYQLEIRNNGGVSMSVIDEPLGEEAPVVK